MQSYILLSIILIFLIQSPIVKSGLNIQVETRYSPDEVPFNTYGAEEFGNRLRDMIEADTQPSGYCTATNPSYPISNGNTCGGGTYNVGFIWTFTFDETQASHYEIDFGTDFGAGSAIYVNGVFEVSYQQDFWWEHNWASNGVFNLVYDFQAGQNIVKVYGRDYCCDGGMYVQFSRNYQTKKLLTPESFDCAMTNNCPGVSCNNNQYQSGPDCHNCNYKCATCSNSATNCLSCNDSSNRILGSGCACKDGYYDVTNNQNCQSCHNSCKTCSNGSSCSTCESNEYKDTLCYSCANRHGSQCGTCTKNSCSTCANNTNYKLPACNSTSCPSGQYQDGNWCRDCINNCISCNNGSTCNTCDSSVSYKTGSNTCALCHNSCTTCSNGSSCDTCQQTEYLDTTCKQCTTTHGSHCGTCTQAECSTCNNNSSYTLPTCTGTTCPTGQYKSGTWCRDCVANCDVCNNSSTCQTCADTHYLGNDNLCHSCIAEHGNLCGTCTGAECSTCNNNATYTLPTCTGTTCPTGQYKSGTWCRDCVANCDVCNNSSTCQTCTDTHYLGNDNLCHPCNNTCGTCTGGTSCDSCNPEDYLNTLCYSCALQHGNHCGTCTQSECSTCLNSVSNKLPLCTSTTCPQGQYIDGNWCKDCHSSCLSCSDGESCDSCTPDKYLDTLCKDCTTTYGPLCGTCSTSQCLTCGNDSTFVLPACDSTTCPFKHYQQGMTCYRCKQGCVECTNSTDCQKCEDNMFLDSSNDTCHFCQFPCLLCTGLTECTLCQEKGFQTPGCTECEGNFYKSNYQCIQKCPEGTFRNTNTNQCEACDDSCFDCQSGAYNCISCPNLKILYNGKCVDCEDIPGMEQDPDQPQGICREVCGDGFMIPTSTHECDDGNLLNGDGCNDKCMKEDGFNCSTDSQGNTICKDKRPIGFKVEFLVDDQYLNIEEQAPIRCRMNFNKTFVLPSGTSLADYILLSVDGKTINFSVNVEKSKQNKGNKRILTQNNDNPAYDLDIFVDETIKNRNMVVDLYPKSAFDDGSGNNLADEPPPQGPIKEYYYYTEEERANTSKFQLMMYIGVLSLMCLLPIYVFWYKNHFNRFYVIFFVIDITQTLYFYRFLNIRWPINGIKFFRTLRPTISFYMWNFFQKDIPDEEYHKFSSGVMKFDLEKESSLFLNNTGSMMALFIIFTLFYGVVVLLSKGSPDSNLTRKFIAIRKGYFEWGIWLDCMLASSGVLIIYILLQFLNPMSDIMNVSLAGIMGVFYGLFFFNAFRYVQLNLSNLYSIEKDELLDDMTLEEKMETNPTFKMRNAWHFIYQLDIFPKKAYFFFFFVLRKFYLATLLLTMQNHPTVQLCMCSFSHFFVVVAFLKYKFFKLKRENIRIIISETLIFIGIGTCYFLLDDKSEDEHYRLKYSWIVLGCLLSSLMVHGLFFFFYEILVNGSISIYKKLQKDPEIAVKQLRDMRKKQDKIVPVSDNDFSEMYNNNNNKGKGRSRNSQISISSGGASDVPLKSNDRKLELETQQKLDSNVNFKTPIDSPDVSYRQGPQLVRQLSRQQKDSGVSLVNSDDSPQKLLDGNTPGKQKGKRMRGAVASTRAKNLSRFQKEENQSQNHKFEF